MGGQTSALGISIDDALYPWWGPDVFSNERRLIGECRCRYDSRAAGVYLELLVTPLPHNQPLVRAMRLSSLRHIPSGTDKYYY